MTNEELQQLTYEYLNSQGIPSYPRAMVAAGEHYQAGFRKALELVLKDIFEPEDPEVLEEDQLAYHLLNMKAKYELLLES
jgi:hypothetical protein